MELDASIEPTIGPYEVYEDESVQLQGRVRGVHHHQGSERIRQIAEVRRLSSGHRPRFTTARQLLNEGA
jgi:hypothetical protein